MSYLRVGIRVTPPSKPPKSHLEEVKFEVSSLTSKTSCKRGKISQVCYNFSVFELVGVSSPRLHSDTVTVTDDDSDGRNIQTLCLNMINLMF